MGKKNRKPDLPNDDELLIELGTLDSIEAAIPTGAEHVAGVVPQWCELRLTMQRDRSDDIGGDFPIKVDVPLRRHDGEMLIEVLGSVLHPNANRHAVDAIWDDMDATVDRIQRRVEKGKDPMKADVGRAQGLTNALAVLDNVLHPDPDSIRNLAMTRYEIRHGLQG